MSLLHTASALIELGAGLALLSFPSPAVALLLGASLEGAASATVARVGGAGLFTLGIACWLAGSDAQSRAAAGVIIAMLFYDVAAAALLAFAGFGLGLYGPGLWPAVVLHAMLALWCVVYLAHGPANAGSESHV
jgi:hypothetical protein